MISILDQTNIRENAKKLPLLGQPQFHTPFQSRGTAKKTHKEPWKNMIPLDKILPKYILDRCVQILTNGHLKW